MNTSDSSVHSSSPHPLRIALLGTRGIPARYGGFETFAEQISRRLADRGYDVTVYGRSTFREGWRSLDPIGGVQRRATPTIFHKYLETPLHALTSFVDLFFKSYDVALVCNAANSPFGFLLNVRGVPWAINVDGIERNRAKWNSLGKLWYRLGEWSSVAFANKVVADADVIAEYYQSTYNCSSVVIPYGVHPTVRPAGDTLSAFKLQPRNYLLYVSRLEPENNALGVIRAYRDVETDMPLVIVGDAPYAAEYKEQLRREADPRVVFTGFQFGAAYEEFQSNCYLYIQATEVGGTHPALIESMSYGNCVVVNGTPENLEVIGECGRSYPKNSFGELSATLSELVRNADEVRRLGDAARSRVMNKYSWDAIVECYEDLLSGLAKRPRE